MGLELLELAGGRNDGVGLTIVEGVSGNAEKAGMQVGDVIVAVTGLFGEMDTVLLSGVDKM